MNMKSSLRYALPAAGVSLVVLTICQTKFSTAAAAPAAPPAATSAAAGVRAEGRVAAYPGAEVTISSERAGVFATVLVREGDRVRAGQPLAAQKDDETAAALAEARAREDEAAADERLARAELRRVEALVGGGYATASRLDAARRDLDAARARRATAAAAARRVAAEHGKTRVLAPISGTVTGRFVQPGESVDARARLFTLADLTRTRVEAEIDEFDAGRVVLGAPVTLVAEGYDGKSWRGVVEEIPDRVGPPQLRPQDPGRPADTRVLLVKIKLLEPVPFKLGQRVEVEVGK